MRLPSDPGLQPERTALAWRRTALALSANGLLVGRSALVESSVWLGAIAVIVLLGSAGLLVVAWDRRRSLLGAEIPQAAPHAAVVAAVVAAAFLISVAALLML